MSKNLLATFLIPLRVKGTKRYSALIVNLAYLKKKNINTKTVSNYYG
jgi:hypothetical protein